VARTVKPATVRRNEILDVAEDLFCTRGYARTSIQDIIDAVGIARGTLYHHFDSKSEVLGAVIERMLEGPVAKTERLLARRDLDALEKLQAFYREVGIWEIENKELVWQLLEAFHREENVSLRYEVLRRGTERILPLVARIIEQGVDESLLSADHPVEVAAVVLAIWTDVSSAVGNTLLESGDRPEGLAAIERRVRVCERSIERVLGAPDGSLELLDIELAREFLDARPAV
jgi:AcrR family transcriptional regulator